MMRNITRDVLGNVLSSVLSGDSGSPTPATPTSMGDIVASNVFDLDARLTDSYPGTGETWFNLNPSPADGDTQSNLDFWLGKNGSAGTDDPTFSTNKFTTDGGDCFSLKSNTGASRNPTIKALGRTDSSQATFFFDCRIGASILNNDYMFGVGTSNSGNCFFSIGTEADGDLRILVFNDNGTGTSVNSLIISVPAGLTINTDYILGVAVDFTNSTNNIRVWVNSSTAIVQSQAFATNTADTEDGCFILARPSSAKDTPQQHMPNGFEISGICGFNAFLDNTAAGLIISEYARRAAL